MLAFTYIINMIIAFGALALSLFASAVDKQWHSQVIKFIVLVSSKKNYFIRPHAPM